MSIWTFYLLTVLGLLVLRVKEPHLRRPYKTFLITPITFCIVAMFLLLMPIFAAPWEALAAFTFIAMGVPMYYLTTILRRGPTQDQPGFKTVISIGWDELKEDVGRWRPRAKRKVIEPQEESRQMLRDELEMSER